MRIFFKVTYLKTADFYVQSCKKYNYNCKFFTQSVSLGVQFITIACKKDQGHHGKWTREEWKRLEKMNQLGLNTYMHGNNTRNFPA
jgi:hypothetical protein